MNTGRNTNIDITTDMNVIQECIINSNTNTDTSVVLITISARTLVHTLFQNQN